MADRAQSSRSTGDTLAVVRLFAADRPLTSLAVGASDDVVLAGCEDGSIRVWSLSDAEAAERRLTGPAREVWALATAHAHGRSVAIGSGEDPVLRLWDVTGGAPIGQPLQGHTAPVNAVAAGLIADGSHIAVSGSDDASVRLWDLATESSKAVLHGHTHWVNAVALAAHTDGSSILVSGSTDRTLRVWDPVTGEPLATLTGHTDSVSSVAVAWTAARGFLAISGGNDETVRIWDLADGRPIQTTHVHSGRVRAVALGTLNGELVAVSAGNDRTVRVWDPLAPDPEPLVLRGHTQPVRAVTVARMNSRDVILSCGDDGTVRAWGTPDARPAADRLEWLPDSPATIDLLRREPLARTLAIRLRRVCADEPGVSFLIHIDGPWGAGKSTLISMLEKELTPDWTIVHFNAWRQSRVGPPWWALLAALRRDIGRGLGPLGRLGLRTTESWSRLRRSGPPFALAAVVLLVVAATAYLLLRPTGTTWKDAGELVKTLTAAATAVSAAWAAALVARRLLLWDSAKGARLFEQSNNDPMQNVADHFGWLVAKAKRPVVFVIDDLDRCPQAYVVELLEAVQTLVRDAAEPSADPSHHAPAAYFVVAADGAWIRTSYEIAYEGFADSIAEPGRPLGYLFLDKLFQLRVPIPTIDTVKQDAYLRELLGLGTARQVRQLVSTEEQAVRRHLDESRTEAQVVAALQNASPIVRDRVAASAVARLTTPEIFEATEHNLQKFAPLLPPNPRSMKRFLNAYAALRAVRTLEGNTVPTAPLALWTILEIRWPSLADYLRAAPAQVDLLVTSTGSVDNVPVNLRSLFADDSVRHLATFKHGGPLTAALISACSGAADYRTDSTG